MATHTVQINRVPVLPFGPPWSLSGSAMTVRPR
jgi:hypothetical protein